MVDEQAMGSKKQPARLGRFSVGSPLPVSSSRCAPLHRLASRRRHPARYIDPSGASTLVPDAGCRPSGT